MSGRVLRVAIFIVVLGGAGAAGCGGPGYGYESTSVTVASGYAGYVWVDGNWAWRNGGWVWVPGYWIPERPGFVYIDGYWGWGGAAWIWYEPNWVRHRPGWYWDRGYWRDGHYVPGRWNRGTVVRDHRDRGRPGHYRHRGGTPPPSVRGGHRPTPPRFRPTERVRARRGR